MTPMSLFFNSVLSQTGVLIGCWWIRLDAGAFDRMLVYLIGCSWISKDAGK
jgi:hypothetical protein